MQRERYAELNLKLVRFEHLCDCLSYLLDYGAHVLLFFSHHVCVTIMTIVLLEKVNFLLRSFIARFHSLAIHG